MSSHAWTEDGVGFALFQMKKDYTQIEDMETVLSFICDNLHKIREVDSEMLEEICSCRTPGEYFECMEEYPSETIAEIINKEENTSLFCGFSPDMTPYMLDDQSAKIYGVERLGVGPVYPWLLSEKDKAMTKEKAFEILAKYAKLFGREPIIDRFEARYFG